MVVKYYAEGDVVSEHLAIRVAGFAASVFTKRGRPVIGYLAIHSFASRGLVLTAPSWGQQPYALAPVFPLCER